MPSIDSLRAMALARKNENPKLPYSPVDVGASEIAKYEVRSG